MKLCLSRAGGAAEVHVRFPTDPETVQDAVAQLDSLSEGAGKIEITNVVCPIKNLTGYIRCANLESEADIHTLNILAERIIRMTPPEQRIFTGALDAESINGLADVLSVATNLEKYLFIPHVTSDRELGKHLVNIGYLSVSEKLRPYINYESVGIEYYANFGGAYTGDGYVRRRDVEPMLGQDEKTVFCVELQAHKGARQYIASVDLLITHAGQEWYSEDYQKSDSFRQDPVVADALPQIQQTLAEPDGPQMGGMSL